MEPGSSLPFSQEQPLFPVLRHMNLVHNSPPYFYKIHCNINFPSTSRSSELPLPFRFSDQNFIRISNFSNTCYISSHLIPLELIILSSWESIVKSTKKQTRRRKWNMFSCSLQHLDYGSESPSRPGFCVALCFSGKVEVLLGLISCLLSELINKHPGLAEAKSRIGMYRK
jgi:hypothetical protein